MDAVKSQPLKVQEKPRDDTAEAVGSSVADLDVQLLAVLRSVRRRSGAAIFESGLSDGFALGINAVRPPAALTRCWVT